MRRPLWRICGQLAVIDGHALIGELPDQALAQAHLLQHDLVGGDGQRPLALDHGGVDLGGVAVGIQVGAREMRLHPAHAQARRKGVDLLHMRVLGLAQRGQRQAGAEVRRVDRAAVRRVQHHGTGAGNAGDHGRRGIGRAGACRAGQGLQEVLTDQSQDGMHEMCLLGCADATRRAHSMNRAQPHIRHAQQGPSRSEGVVPLPRSERGGRREAPQGEP